MTDISIKLMRGELTIGDAINEIERLEEALIQANKTIASIRALVQNNESSNLYTINKKIV